MLYNVDRPAISPAGSGGRSSLLNYPLALGAIALAAVAGGPRLLVWAAIALCAVTARPGVVDQDDLDARWINALPALGVALALALTVAAVRRDGVAFARRARGDRLRLVLGVALLLLALPWLAAETGFYFPGDVFMGEEIPPVRDEGSPPCISASTTAWPASCSRSPRSRSRAPRRARARGLPLADARLRPRERGPGRLERAALEARHGRSPHRERAAAGALRRAGSTIVAGAAAIYALWFRPARQR